MPGKLAVAAPPAISEAEVTATLDALRRPGRARPLIAIIGANGETETETND